jgi:hypothetical protein
MLANRMMMAANVGGPDIGTPTSLGTGSNSGASVTTTTITTGANIVAGDCAVVGWYTADGVTAARSVSSVSDGTNTYTRLNNFSNGTNEYHMEIWYCANCSAVSSGGTITITHTSSGGGGSMRSAGAFTVSGIISSPADTAPTGEYLASSTTPSVASGALAKANEIVVGMNASSSAGSYTEDAEFTNVNTITQSGQILHLSYNIVAATTSVTFNPTWSSAGTQVTIVGSLKGY